jgi:hypothetical protein
MTRDFKGIFWGGVDFVPVWRGSNPLHIPGRADQG